MFDLKEKLKRLAALDTQDFRERYEIANGPQGSMQLRYLIAGAQCRQDILQPLIEALIAVAEAAEQSLWIDECRCDDAWTLRHKHAPDTYCGELNDVREALTALEKLSGDVK